MAVVTELHAFLDDSGLHENPRLCGVAGFVGSPQRWERFGHDWERIFADTPELANFHSIDFFGGRGAYRSLTGEKRGKIIDEIVQSLHRHRLRSVGAMLDVPTFNSLSYGERRYLTGGVFNNRRWLTSGAPSKPYFAAFIQCIYLITKNVDLGKKVHFIFDEQNAFAPNALEIYSILKHNPQYDLRDRMGGCFFMSRGEATALCAADLLTHCWFSSWTAGMAALDSGTLSTAERALIRSQYKHSAFHRLGNPKGELLVLKTRENLDLLLSRLPEKGAR